MVGLLAQETPDILASPEDNALLRILVRCLSGSDGHDARSGGRRHEAIIAHFEEYLETHSGRAIYLPEICAAIGAAERTLRASCEEHFGMGPIRYLTLRRMHLTRRALLRGRFQINRHANRHRSRLLGTRSLFGRLSFAVRGIPLAHIA